MKTGLVILLVVLFIVLPILLGVIAIFGLFNFGISTLDQGYCFLKSGSGVECVLMSEGDCQKKGGTHYKTFEECQEQMNKK